MRASPPALADAVEPDLRAIAEARSPEVLGEQLALLADPQRPLAVREAAARALATSKTPGTERPLVDLANASDEAGRTLAIGALARRGDSSPATRAALDRLLWDDSPGLRVAAARAVEGTPLAPAVR